MTGEIRPERRVKIQKVRNEKSLLIVSYYRYGNSTTATTTATTTDQCRCISLINIISFMYVLVINIIPI